MTLDPSVPALDAAALRSLVADTKRLERGTELFDRQGVLLPSRFRNKLLGDVKGSESRPYKVSIEFDSNPTSMTATCTCIDAASCPVCKHAAALLVAWTRAPESFVVSDTAPPTGSVKVKEGKTTEADVMRSSVEQVDTLIRELGVVGIGTAGKDRIHQIRKLGESFRENELVRLSSLTMDFAHLLGAYGSSAGAIGSTRYADLVADMLLTVRKLGKYLAGQPLEDRYVEELIGRKWKDSETKPAQGLRLVEVAFSTRETTNDFIVRESRFVDIASGRHYREEQIVRASNERQKDRKLSYAGLVLEGASGGVYPGFPPFRIKLIKTGEQVPLGVVLGPLAALVDVALTDVAAALAAFQEHRRDVFAPDLFPVAVRVGSLFARGPRLEAVDEKGDTLHLCDDPRIEEQLGDALHDGRLLALIGDIGIDAAIPTLWPLASIIEGPLGLELRTIHDEPSPSKRRKLVASARRPAREVSSWSKAARAAGVSAAAIAVGEVREELADGLVSGLAGRSSRAFGSLVQRLYGLGFDKPAALLESSAKKAEPAERLDDFIKIYQALGMILVRLAGATRVDLAALAPVPGYESLHVARPLAPLAPGEIQAMRAQGIINRYEAVLHFARHFEGLAPEAVAANIYPTWADGSTGPYVARAFAARGLTAVEAAERVLTEGEGRMAKITAIHVLAAVESGLAEDVLQRVVHTELDPTLRRLAEDALDVLDLKAGKRAAVERRRAVAGRRLAESVKRLLTETQKEKRMIAVTELCELGDRGAIRALRQAFVGDATPDVREKAAYALARLGDTYMVETFARTVAARKEPHAIGIEIDIAAHALGMLGDVRGLGELIAAYAEGYSPMVMADAIKAFGAAATEPFLDSIEAHPEIGRRRAAQNILEHLPAAPLGESLARRLADRSAAMSADPAAFTERAGLYLRLADVQSKSRKIVAKAICEHLGASEDKADKALVKLAHKALGIL